MTDKNEGRSEIHDAIDGLGAIAVVAWPVIVVIGILLMLMKIGC